MDPVSAVGIAAAALQFLEFSKSALDLCIEIRDDATSATEYNKKLEEDTRTARKFRQDLACPILPGSNSKVTAVAQACIKEADQLAKLLEYVRGAEMKARGKQIHTAKALLRALKEKKDIEKLRNRLASLERQLTDMLVKENYIRVEALHREAKTNHTKLEVLVDELKRLQASSGVGNRTALSALSGTESRLQTRARKAERNLHAHMCGVESRTQALQGKAAEAHTRQQFLASLAFPEMYQRRDSIREAQLGTLDWVYDMMPDDGKPRWANFGTWLRKDTSVYWICGRAASGKSTLMAHIVHDHRTTEALQVWSQGHQLCMPSVYFWRPGSELQKSNIGLLRSLLYQMCAALPATIDLIRQKQAEPPSFAEPLWTERRLTVAIQTAIEAAIDVRFCVFVDGLDEFTGQYDDLVNLIFKLQRHRNQLRMQDLNRSDIKTHVATQLTSDAVPLDLWRSNREQQEDLIGSVVRRADGIFLWAVLVTRSLIKGIRSGDDIQMLHKRLDETPREINALFEHMVGNIDNIHRPSLAFVLHAMRVGSFHAHYYDDFIPDICSLTAARLDMDITSYKDFSHACQLTETRILAQSAGLLELQTSYHRFDQGSEPFWDAVHSHIDPDPERSWKESPSHFFVRALEDEVRPATKCVREAWHPPGDFPDFLALERSVPRWVHRSAFDFCFPGDGSPSPIHFTNVQESDFFQSMSQGLLRTVRQLPSYQYSGLDADFTVETSTWYRLDKVLAFHNMIYLYHDALASDMIDKLAALMADMDVGEFVGSPWDTFGDTERVRFTGDIPFLVCCMGPMGRNLWKWVFTGIQKLHAEMTGNATLLPLLYCYLTKIHGASLDSVYPTLVASVESQVAQIELNFQLENPSEHDPKRIRKVFMGNARTGNYHWNRCGSISCLPSKHLSTSPQGHLQPLVYVLLAQTAWMWFDDIDIFDDQHDDSDSEPDDPNRILCLPTSELCKNIEGAFDRMIGALSMSIQLEFRIVPRSSPKPILHASNGVCRSWLPRIGIFRRGRQDGEDLSRLTSDAWCAMFLVCMPHGLPPIEGEKYFALDQALTFKLSTSTLHAFQKIVVVAKPDGFPGRSICFGGTHREFNALYDVVIADIWDNADGLDATEQLFVLACARMELRDWFEQRDAVDDTEGGKV
ncbi:hypothetical protein LTR85_000087 [Meristemomyces frigidus]|nr:hypothetical protein LTR85_000087 [Meristemomyces frigidus]